jgi:hypothetical protein
MMESMGHRLLSKTINDYSNPNDNYSPSVFVKYGSELTPDDFSVNTDYLTKSLTTSGVVCIVGLICMLLFGCGMLFRCCCTCCRCLPKIPVPVYQAAINHDVDEENHIEMRNLGANNDIDTDRNVSYPCSCRRVITILLLTFSCMIALACDQFMLVGRYHVSHSLYTTKHAINEFQSILTSAVNYSDVLYDYGDDITTDLNSAWSSCSYTTYLDGVNNTIASYVTEYQSAVSNISTEISPINNKITKYKTKLQLFANGAVFYILWALGIVAVVLPILFMIFQKRVETMCAMWFTVFVYLIFVLLGFLWMIIVSIGGDFCQEPTYHTLVNLPISGTSYELIEYYTTCTIGNNTINTHINQAYGYVNQFSAAIDTALIYCPTTTGFLDMQDIVTNINATIPKLQNLTNCDSLQSIWFELINDALCTKMYTGIFYIWGSQLLTAFGLFFMLFFLVIVYQYHLPLKEMLPPTEADIQQHYDALRPSLPSRDIHGSEFLRMESSEQEPDQHESVDEGEHEVEE